MDSSKEVENELLRKAQEGDLEAQHQMGLLFSMDEIMGGTPNIATARSWFEKAAAKGFAPSMVELKRLDDPKIKITDWVAKAASNTFKTHPRVEPSLPSVIIVDDEEDGYLMIKDVLSGEKVRTLYAKTGEKALQLIAKEPDILLVILDVQLPGLNGLQVLNSLRKFESGDNIKVIMISGYTAPEHIIEAKKHNILSWMVKPFDVIKLHVIIKSFLKARG